MKLLLMADSHIKTRTSVNNAKITDDAYESLHKVKSYVKNNDIDTLLIAGDWFDTNRPSSTDLIETKNFLNSFSRVYYIRGNHDSINPSYLSALNNENKSSYIYELDNDFIIFDNFAIAGISWINNKETLYSTILDLCNRIKSNNINKVYLMLHTCFKHLFGFDFAYRITEKDIQTIAKDTDMCINVLVGHIHIRDTITYTLSENLNGFIHSPGSLYPTTISDIDKPHYVSLIDTDSDIITDINTDVRLYKTVEFDTLINLDSYIDSIVSENKYNLLPVVYVKLKEDYEGPNLYERYKNVIIQVVKDIDHEGKDSENESLKNKAGHSDYTIVNAVTEEASVEEDIIQDLIAALLISDDPIKTLNELLDVWEVKRI